MRTRFLSLGIWIQKLRTFFEALRLDEIAFCKLERLNHQKQVRLPLRSGTDDDLVYINFSRQLDDERNSTTDRCRWNRLRRSEFCQSRG
jgi:hypothetical protein